MTGYHMQKNGSTDEEREQGKFALIVSSAIGLIIYDLELRYISVSWQNLSSDCRYPRIHLT